MEEIYETITEFIIENDETKLIEAHIKDTVRMSFIIDTLNMCNIIPPKSIPPGKDSDQARIYNEKANNILVRNCTSQQLQEACQMFTKSVAYAPPHSVELCLAYFGRSTVLFRLRKYEQCLRDIEKSFSLNIPAEIKTQILIRKTECLVLMKSPYARKAYNFTQNWIDEHLKGNDKDRFRKKLDICYKKWGNHKTESKRLEIDLDDFFKGSDYVTHSEEIPSSSDALTLNHDICFGRYIVATRDINPGEIIANEKPYCSILHVNKRYAQCWGCLRTTYHSIPCDNCPNVIYCSENCKNESWAKFHDIECKILSSLFNLEAKGMELVGIASLRMTILAFKEFKSISKLIKEVNEVDKNKDLRTKGFSNDGKFYSNKYRSVYSLSINTERLLWHDIVYRMVYSAIILYYLATDTTFFGEKLDANWITLNNNYDALFIGGLILRNYHILAANAFSERETCDGKVRDEGALILPFFSLINHSCHPNISRSNRNGHQILFATYPIMKGEQIFYCYGLSYFEVPLKTRQRLLNEQYSFICECIACEENWPVKEDLQSLNMLVENVDLKRVLQQAMLRFSPYIRNLKSVTKMIEDMPRSLEMISETLKMILNYIDLPCKEIHDLTELLKAIFENVESLKEQKLKI